MEEPQPISEERIISQLPSLFPEPMHGELDDEMTYQSIHEFVFEKEDIQNCIRHMKTSTASGASGISIAYIKRIVNNRKFIELLKISF